MQASLRALLADILDYAGLFPPAGLDLDTAIRNHARYVREPEAWMLARFICPVSKLDDLKPLAQELFDETAGLRLSVLGTTTESSGRFADQVGKDLALMRDFAREMGTCASVEAIEIRLPTDLTGASQVADLLDGSPDLRSGQVPVFLEPPLGVDRAEVWPAIVQGVGNHNHRTVDGASPPVGVKLRCGGLDASAFPSVDELAAAIWAAHEARVPLKFTAGLHHPLRHYDAGMEARMHGFFNVFIGGVLVASRAVCDLRTLRDILDTEDPTSFEFDEAFVGWRGKRTSTDSVIDGRQRAVTSLGSCSFDEPRDDLRALRLLPEPADLER